MKVLLRNEFRRFWNNKLVFAALGIGIILCLLQFAAVVLPYHNAIMQPRYPVSLFAVWMGGENYSVYGMLYYLIVPLFIALPYNGTFKEDLKQGYIKNIFIREKKIKYFLSKYLVCFSSGILGVIPVALNFMLSGMICPGILPQSGTSFFSLFSNNFGAELFYSHPYVYVCLYLLMDFVFWGFLSTLSLLASFFTAYSVTAKLIPFMVQLFLYGAHLLLPSQAISPAKFLQPSQPLTVQLPVLLIEFTALILCGIIYLVYGMKEELYA